MNPAGPTPSPVARAGRAWALRPWLAATLVAVLCLWLFRPTVEYGFVMFDDDANIYFNPRLGEATPANLAALFLPAPADSRFQPLGWLGFSIVFTGWGLDPAAYHAANVLLHALNALLAFAVLRALLGRVAPAAPPAVVTWAALGGAVLWALHPLRVELVAWASGQLYLHATFWLLWAMLAYLRAKAPAARPGRWLAFSVAAYALSLLTYPIALSLPVVLLILELWEARRSAGTDAGGRATRGRAIARRLGWFFALALAAVVVAVLARAHAPPERGRLPGLAEFGLTARAAQALYVWCHYLWKSAVPVALSPVYEQLQTVEPWAPRFVAAGVGVIGLTLALFWQRRRWPGAWWSWLAYLALVAPYVGVLESPFYPCDRYSYVPALALSFAVAWIVASGWRFRWATTAVGVAWVAILAVASRRQMPTWRDTPALFQHVVAHLHTVPAQPYEEARWAVYEVQLGDFSAAEARVQAAQAAAPDDATIRAEADLIARLRRGASADLTLAPARGAVAPAAREAHRLALRWAHAGRTREALVHFAQALAFDPDYQDARYNRALLLARSGEAAAALADALWLEGQRATPLPTDARARLYQALARAWGERQQPRLAAACATRASAATAPVPVASS